MQSAGLQDLSDLLSNNVLNMFVIAFVLSWVLPENMSFTRKKQAKQVAQPNEKPTEHTDGTDTVDADND